MGNRMTTTCDGAGCTAEFANPPGPSRLRLGWAMVHGLDEKTGSSFSYDLCPACFQKMIEGLGLVPVEVTYRAQMAALGTVGFPGLGSGLEIEAPPFEPPKMCETCKEPYVGASCYFCPPAGASEDP